MSYTADKVPVFVLENTLGCPLSPDRAHISKNLLPVLQIMYKTIWIFVLNVKPG